MAASMRVLKCQTADKLIKGISNLKPLAYNVVPMSTSSIGNDKEGKRSTASCSFPQGNAILFWHPEQKFPYEHTQPLPRKVPEISEGDSVLKVQYLLEEKLKLRPNGPTDEELSNIFYETKHRWFPKPEKKYKKINPPKDRDGM